MVFALVDTQRPLTSLTTLITTSNFKVMRVVRLVRLVRVSVERKCPNRRRRIINIWIII